MGRDNIQIETLAAVLARLRLLGLDDMIERVDDYARAADIVARSDIELLTEQDEPDRLLETMILGTVIGDALFAALRRIAQAETSIRTFEKGGPDEPHD
ncbi:hypothetical protein GCM10029992_67240 [Glycomyces albus]